MVCAFFLCKITIYFVILQPKLTNYNDPAICFLVGCNEHLFSVLAVRIFADVHLHVLHHDERERGK